MTRKKTIGPRLFGAIRMRRRVMADSRGIAGALCPTGRLAGKRARWLESDYLLINLRTQNQQLMDCRRRRRRRRRRRFPVSGKVECPLFLGAWDRCQTRGSPRIKYAKKKKRKKIHVERRIVRRERRRRRVFGALAATRGVAGGAMRFLCSAESPRDPGALISPYFLLFHCETGSPRGPAANVGRLSRAQRRATFPARNGSTDTAGERAGERVREG